MRSAQKEGKKGEKKEKSSDGRLIIFSLPDFIKMAAARFLRRRTRKIKVCNWLAEMTLAIEKLRTVLTLTWELTSPDNTWLNVYWLDSRKNKFTSHSAGRGRVV